MCEFCTKHGDGKKWYLQAKNYAEDLMNDLRRRRFVDHFFRETMRGGPSSPGQSLARLQKAPAVLRRIISGLVTRRMKRDHFGQVVPIEDVEKILGICNGIVRIPCVCRRLTQGKDAAYCMGVSINPHRSFVDGIISKDYWSGPDGAGLERLTREQAIALMREFEKEGLCHSVWSFVTPFIGGYATATAAIATR